MNKKLLKTGLVFCVIFLFFGTAVQPITSVNITKIEQVESNYLVNYPNSEEDCNCKKVNTQDLARFNKILDRMEFKIKLIILTYGFIPDVKAKLIEILDILETYYDEPNIICAFINMVVRQLCLVLDYLYEKAQELYNSGQYILGKYYEIIYKLLWNYIDLTFFPFWFVFCWLSYIWYWPPWPLLSKHISK